jgi:hypothetical protein
MSVPTTLLATNGDTLSYAAQVNTWYAYLDGYQPEDLQDALVDALITAQQQEFNNRLPDACHWHMSTSEVTGPVGTVLDRDPDELMQEAVAAVQERFDEIEASVKASQPGHE